MPALGRLTLDATRAGGVAGVGCTFAARRLRSRTTAMTSGLSSSGGAARRARKTSTAATGPARLSRLLGVLPHQVLELLDDAVDAVAGHFVRLHPGGFVGRVDHSGGDGGGDQHEDDQCEDEAGEA